MRAMQQTGETIKTTNLDKYKIEMQGELDSILRYWMEYTLDNEYGGFYGSVNSRNIADTLAPKGVVLNSRILWTFAAAYNHLKDNAYLQVAERAFQYLTDHFIDHEYGGVFWSVNHKGEILDSKKQIYGLAFCIYGMTEYYKASGDNKALSIAKDLFSCIERYSHDNDKQGYVEAFTREWEMINDLRLSEKDDNERKTMNTHLHIVEAYAALFQVWPDENLKNKVTGLLGIFRAYIINRNTFHLNLFMDDNWNVKSTLQSFGHDVEAAWLLQECAEAVNADAAIPLFKEYAILLADAAAEGLDKDGGLWYEYDVSNKHWIREKHSWPQAEAMVGFFNAFELTGSDRYLRYSIECWEFVKKYLRDDNNGEWYWGVQEDYAVMQKDKAGFWKCPYHGSRACIEIIQRINNITGV